MIRGAAVMPGSILRQRVLKSYEAARGVMTERPAVIPGSIRADESAS